MRLKSFLLALVSLVSSPFSFSGSLCLEVLDRSQFVFFLSGGRTDIERYPENGQLFIADIYIFLTFWRLFRLFLRSFLDRYQGGNHWCWIRGRIWS